MSLLLEDPPPAPPPGAPRADEPTGTHPPHTGGRLHRLAAFGRRHRWLRTMAALVAVVLATASVSYVQKLREPGNDTFTERSVEWLRDVHLGALVNLGEQIGYALHPPVEGGTPDRAIDAPTTTPEEDRTGRTDHLPPPAPLVSPASPAQPGEGQWHPVGPTIGGTAGLYTTQIRPDAVHTSFLELVAWMDPKVVRFQLHPGTEVPGGQWSTPSSVGGADQANLVAAFNGGFRMQDAQGGFYADGKGASSMRDGDATLAIDDQGVATVGQWGRDVTMGPNLAAARQNLALIVDGGQPVPDLDENPHDKWGATVGNKVFVWRSGAGVTADGALVYVAGPSLSAKSLAETLARAGAVRAMELDINHDWVSFNAYAADGGHVSGSRLLPEMMKPGDRYLSTDSRDFVAVLLRDPATSAPDGSAPTTTTTAAPPASAAPSAGKAASTPPTTHKARKAR